MAKVLTRSSNPKTVSTSSKISSRSTGYAIFVLSDSDLEKIFRFLTYHELTSARSVCRWFYHVVGAVMNKKFMCLTREVELELDDEKCEDEPSESRLKVLSVVLSEVRMMESHCLCYVEASMFYFFGGMILDYFNYIMRGKKSEELMTDVSEFFMLVDHFLNTFDSVSEPILLERSFHLPFSWFAKKFVDVLECYNCVEHFVAVEPIQEGARVKWTGKYTSSPIHSLLPPPFIANSTEGVKADMDALLKYVRNHVRWNNILDTIKGPCDATKRFEDRIMLEDGSSQAENNQKIVCERINLDRIDSSDPKHMEINIGLFAHEIFAPSRYKVPHRNYSPHYVELFDTMVHFGSTSDEEEDTKSTDETTFDRSTPQKEDYEMDLTIEITYREQEIDLGQISYRTRTYQICHIDNCCYIASNTTVMH